MLLILKRGFQSCRPRKMNVLWKWFKFYKTYQFPETEEYRGWPYCILKSRISIERLTPSMHTKGTMEGMGLILKRCSIPKWPSKKGVFVEFCIHWISLILISNFLMLQVKNCFLSLFPSVPITPQTHPGLWQSRWFLSISHNSTTNKDVLGSAKPKQLNPYNPIVFRLCYQSHF